MRKQILLLIVMLACVAIFGACFDDETGTSECQHSGGVATCQKKAVCEKCGEEYGELAAHAYGEWKYNAEKHWKECTTDGCDSKTEESNHEGGTKTCIAKAVCEKCGEEYGELAAHAYGEWKYDAEKHWKECTTEGCDSKTEEAAHAFTKTGSDSEKHWKECECGAKSEEEAHNYTENKFDTEKHWKECECGAKSEETAHVLSYNKDDAQHWQKCDCGYETAKADHAYNVWNKTDSRYDRKACECGAVDSMHAFNKKVSLIRQEWLMTDSEFALNISGISEYVSVESVKLGEYDLGTNLNALTVSDELIADTRIHGNQTIIVIVKDDEEETHEIKVPVLLITAKIATAGDLIGIQPKSDNKGVYGYYILTKDVSDNALAGSAYSGDWEETTGFFGTFDGQGHTISMAANGGNGLFGFLRNATIKNVTIKDNWRSAYKSYALLAKASFNSTFENVTFTFAAGNTNAAVGDGFGWICYAEFSGNTLRNVTVNDAKGYGSLFGYKFKNNIFENVVINGTYTEMGHLPEVKDADGNVIQEEQSVTYDDVTKIDQEEIEEITLDGRQDFVLDGKVSTINLGEYDGAELISIRTSTGYDIYALSSDVAPNSFKTAVQSHGEQDFIILANYGDKKVRITVHVTVITKAISTMAELQDSVKHTGKDIYGYFILANDVSVNEEGFTAKNATYAWNSGTGFKGTLDGRKHTITHQGNKSQHGLFGTLNGATVKNVTIKNAWYNGWGASTLGYTAYNTTFENVKFEVSGATVAAESGKGVIVGTETGGCVWKNVEINVAVAEGSLFWTLNKNGKTDTFENVTVTIPSLEKFSNNGTPEGVTINQTEAAA